MSKIDNLYKRAFGSDNHQYNDSDWSKMESLLDESMPVSSSGSWLNRAASFTIVAAVTLAGVLFNSPTEITGLPEIIALTAEEGQKVSVAENNATEPIESIVVPVSVAPKLAVVKSEATMEETPHSNNLSNHAKNRSRIKIISLKNNGLMLAKTSTSINKDALDFQPKLPANGNFSTGSISTFDSSTPVLASESNSTVVNEIPTPRSMTSLKFMDSPKLSFSVESVSLMDYDFRKTKKIRHQITPDMFIGAAFISEKLDNDNDLNINVSEEIKNVALVDVKNKNYESGLSVGMKWRGFVVSSGIMYKQQSAAYKLYYSHTKNWEETSVNSETNLARVDSTYLNDYHIEEVIINDSVTYQRVNHYAVDSVYKTTSDTTHTAYSNTDKLDEKFAYKVHYVTIPLNVGYEHQISRFFVSVSVGMNMSFLSSVSGSIYNPETNKVESIINRDALNPVLYTANASVGIGYDVTNQLSVVVKPRLSKALNSSFKEDSDFATTYLGYGANFSLRYRF